MSQSVVNGWLSAEQHTLIILTHHSQSMLMNCLVSWKMENLLTHWGLVHSWVLSSTQLTRTYICYWQFLDTLSPMMGSRHVSAMFVIETADCRTAQVSELWELQILCIFMYCNCNWIFRIICVWNMRQIRQQSALKSLLVYRAMNWAKSKWFRWLSVSQLCSMPPTPPYMHAHTHKYTQHTYTHTPHTHIYIYTYGSFELIILFLKEG